MRKPSDFKKSIALMQGFQLVIYSIVGSVLYTYGGQVRPRLAGARTPSWADPLSLAQYTPSPALTMTNHKLAIASYAFALVTIIVSGIVAVNVRPLPLALLDLLGRLPASNELALTLSLALQVGAKFFYTQLFRNSSILTSDSWKAQLYWLAIIFSMYGVAFVIAELIPVRPFLSLSL